MQEAKRRGRDEVTKEGKGEGRRRGTDEVIERRGQEFEG